MRERSRIRTRSASGPITDPVRVLRIAAGGDGVARLPDGRTAFVPRTAPGDLVEIRLVHEARRFVRAEPLRVLEPGADRIEPPCPHYTRDACGGCQIQHLVPAAQLSAKQSIVGESLRRLGKLELADPFVVPAERAWEYRTRITLAPGHGARLGLHRYDRPGEVFDLDRCLITEPSLMRLWTVLKKHRKWLPSDLVHLVLRLDREGGRHVVAETRGDRVWDAARLAAALARVGEPAVLWWQPEGGAARVLAGDSTYPATVFEQVNPVMGDLVRSFALEQLGEVRGRQAWDLFAGIGESTIELARRGAAVDAVESDPRAVAEASQRMEKLGLGDSQVRCISGKAEEVIARLRPPEIVLANPPRVGMDPRLCAAILERRPRRMVYISCDPATLARDLAGLGTGYRVSTVQGFDLFPQTAHVEVVAVLEAA
ncbi:MAG: TRAM domain-containing protein [Gemmatimonadota bacterium]